MTEVPISASLPAMRWLLATACGLLLAACVATPGPELTATPAPTPAAASSAPATPTESPQPPTAGSSLTPVEAATANPTPAAVARFQPGTTQLDLVPVATALSQPVFATHAGDGSGRLFVVERTGAVRILVDGALLPTPFLEIADRLTHAGSEQGLLGLAFAPGYAQSGRLFVNYTDLAGDTVISRFRTAADDPNRADPQSEELLLRIGQPARNHNGGMLLFGPDGALYIGTGDGGAANDRFGNGQNPSTLLGKMLRLDVSDPSQLYRIPADNPFVAAQWQGREVLDEVWALGLRNPWRYSFDRQTGDLWIGDVGQNMIEEINLVPAGSSGGINFGWPILEGSRCFQTSGDCAREETLLPVTEYSHSGGNCSVTGGYVYRGQRFPVLHGVYFYGDFCSGNIWALFPTTDGESGWHNELVLRTHISLSSFGEDEEGELYVTDLRSGTVYRLEVAAD